MLCDFAHSFAELVGDLLEREVGLSRRFREESLTDMWVASLVPLRAYGVAPDLAFEADTGADLEMWFLSKRLDRGVGFVIQAKRAKCNRLQHAPFSCTIGNWRNHRFPDLDHTGGDGRIRGSQARDLVQAARRTGRAVYPLYAFYTPSHVFRASRGVEGVMLADGHSVRRRIVQGPWNTRRRGDTTRRSTAKFKRLGELHDLLIPLSTMFCVRPWRSITAVLDSAELPNAFLLRLAATHFETINIPDPEEVTDAVIRAIRSRRRDGHELPLPSVTKEIPLDIRRLAEGETRVTSATDPDPLGRRMPARRRIAFVATFDRDETT